MRMRAICRVFLALALLTLLGCAGSRQFTATVYEDDTWVVRLRKVPGANAGRGYDHPARIEVDRLESLLAGIGLTVQDGKWMPLFTEYERRRLGELLSQGLREAGRDEVVTFVQVLPASSWQERVTSGGVFVEGARLHFLLANFQVKRGRWQDVETYEAPIEVRPLTPVAPLPVGLSYRPVQRLITPGVAADDFRTTFGLSPWHIALDLRRP